MTIDLDKIERDARAAQERTPGPYAIDRLMTLDLVTRGVVDAQDDEGYAIISANGSDAVEDPALSRELAQHIANCSPDVVLAMVVRIRELEAEVAHMTLPMPTGLK